METFIPLAGVIAATEVLLLYISIKFLIVYLNPKPAIAMLVHVAIGMFMVFEYSNRGIFAVAAVFWVLTMGWVLSTVVRRNFD